MHRIFVYGTLKRGHGNNALMRISEYHGPAMTVPRYRMLEPSFPVVLDDPNGLQVAGEVYHVNDWTLAELDRLEGVASGMYTRNVIEIVQLGGRRRLLLSAYIYVGGERWALSRCPAYTRVNAAGALDWQR